MRPILLMLCLLLPPFLQAQVDKEIVYLSQVRQFYSLFPHKTAWVQDQTALAQLWQLLDSAANLGLEQHDYQFSFISKFRSLKAPVLTADDSLKADYRFTDAAIHFFRDVLAGNSAPAIGYNGLNYSPDWSAVPSLLASALSLGRLANFLNETEPRTGEYIALKSKIVQYNRILNDTTIKKDRKTVEHIAGLNRAINTIRWLHAILQSNDHIIVVNIPSATLLVLQPEGVALESKVIVGQRTKRTPTLCSKIEDVVLYPYWMVPKKIATKELLPLIKRNPGYLDANGYQVVNERGRLVNPKTIDWKSLGADNFPYVLRQSTGCDNSLGIVKLNFYNPYTVYLHDTPWKTLFKSNKRFYSHGCMRLEKAVELAKMILKEKAGIVDSLIDKGCLPDQEPIVIPASEKMPVFVLYNTAWIDSAGTVRFFEDVYGKFPYSRK